MLKKLPLGIQTFRKLRESNCIYVDKTEYAYNLITKGQCYFLSRPRRFGKSLFVSTLKEILSGSKELFEDLWIGTSDYQWKRHAIITLDFTTLNIKSIDLFEESLVETLKIIALEYEIELTIKSNAIQSVFTELIRMLHKNMDAYLF